MKIKKNILKDNKGDTGVGTLIIFIAILLIAGITAAMFIYSGGALQKKALNSSAKVTKSSNEEDRLSTWMNDVNNINISTPKVTPTFTPSNTSTPIPSNTSIQTN